MSRWLCLGLSALVVYELVRYLFASWLRHRLRHAAERFVRTHRVQLDQARFIDRVWLRERLARDPVIDAAVFDAARATGEPARKMRERVDAYVDEIAPYFSMAAYYSAARLVARQIVGFLYELVVDIDGFHAQERQAPEGAVRVYVFNHRSNLDPLLVAYGLLRKVPMSYAVGEWALVWPLDHLFRSFGSYFVRRGEKDPLYHAVLERFVQLHAGHGAVTGFFIEGGLSRDGALRPARHGLLSYLVGLRGEFPDRDIVFLPVGLNYDRVLEDRYLLHSRGGPLKRPPLHWRLLGLMEWAVWLPWLVVANFVRVATRSHRKLGYCAIEFGTPLVLSEWPGGAEIHKLPEPQRGEAFHELAEEVLRRRVAPAIPATPVPVLCAALLADGEDTVAAVRARVQVVLRELRDAGAPVALGEAFASIARRRDDDNRIAAIAAEFDDHLLDAEEAELVSLLAGQSLARRRIVEVTDGTMRVLSGQLAVVQYYANSIVHHLSREAVEVAAEVAPPAMPRLRAQH